MRLYVAQFINHPEVAQQYERPEPHQGPADDLHGAESYVNPKLTHYRIAYVGTFRGVRSPIEGQLTAVVSPSGVGVLFDGWAPSGLLRFVLGDIETMIQEAEVA